MNLGLAMTGQAIAQLNNVCAQRDEKQAKIDRTLRYVRDLLAGPLDANTRMVAEAVEKSLR